MPSKTTFEAQCRILSKIWSEHVASEDFSDFVEYNDIGLPLAYFIHEGLALPSPVTTKFVAETFANLLEMLDIEDSGFEEFEDIFGSENI